LIALIRADLKKAFGECPFNIDSGGSRGFKNRTIGLRGIELNQLLPDCYFLGKAPDARIGASISIFFYV
jgi:hypothetical protein